MKLMRYMATLCEVSRGFAVFTMTQHYDIMIINMNINILISSVLDLD